MRALKRFSKRKETQAPLVIVDYQDVIGDSDLSKEIEAAFGRKGYGVIGIRNVPGFIEAKKALLPKAHDLAHLPKEALEAIEDPKSLYHAGWSHGKEQLGNKPDFAKGSFYFNPLTDKPGTPELQAKYPSFYPYNKWPKELPDLEVAAKDLGQLMCGVAVELARHIDTFAVAKTPNYTPILAEACAKTEKVNGRLLYYFPLDEATAAEGSPDSWIGWHNDSGFLTALAGSMFVDHDTGEQIPNPDPKAGLYVEDHTGKDVKVSIPADCMAIQLGECVPIITGGCVQATPHCVRGASPQPGSKVKVARISHPVFIGVNPDFPLKVTKGTTRESVLKNSQSPKVPDLEPRWSHDGQPFADYQTLTFEAYYKVNNSVKT